MIVCPASPSAWLAPVCSGCQCVLNSVSTGAPALSRVVDALAEALTAGQAVGEEHVDQPEQKAGRHDGRADRAGQRERGDPQDQDDGHDRGVEQFADQPIAQRGQRSSHVTAVTPTRRARSRCRSWR
jgi:hypothetical protein